MFSQKQEKWEKLGLIEPILSSKSDIPFNQSLLSTFLIFWSPTFNCFLLPEGLMLMTLVDIYHLLNLPADGDIILPNFSDPSQSSFHCPLESSHLSNTTFLACEMGRSGSKVTFQEECSFYLYWLCKFLICSSSKRITLGNSPIATALASDRRLALDPFVFVILYRSL